MAEITVLKLPLQRQLIAATYRHDFAEMKRIYYTLYPDDPGAKEWLEEQEKGSNQSPRELASNWVYKVHAWRGKSPEFMQAQVGRLEAVIREAMQKAIEAVRTAILPELGGANSYAHSEAVKRLIKAVASSLTAKEPR
jgi:hypothetical protein